MGRGQRTDPAATALLGAEEIRRRLSDRRDAVDEPAWVTGPGPVEQARYALAADTAAAQALMPPEFQMQVVRRDLITGREWSTSEGAWNNQATATHEARTLLAEAAAATSPAERAARPLAVYVVHVTEGAVTVADADLTVLHTQPRR